MKIVTGVSQPVVNFFLHQALLWTDRGAWLRDVEILMDAGVASTIVAHDVIDALQGQTLGRLPAHEPGRQDDPCALDAHLEKIIEVQGSNPGTGRQLKTPTCKSFIQSRVFHFQSSVYVFLINFNEV